jgi:hypothetical protein
MLPLIPLDKANHFAYGVAISSVGSLHSILSGVVLCALFAVGKEVYDAISKKGTPDVMDVVATMLGVIPILIPLLK